MCPALGSALAARRSQVPAQPSSLSRSWFFPWLIAATCVCAAEVVASGAFGFPQEGTKNSMLQ